MPNLYKFDLHTGGVGWPSKEELEERLCGMNVKIASASNNLFDLTMDLKTIPQHFPPHTFCNITMNLDGRHTCVHLSYGQYEFPDKILSWMDKIKKKYSKKCTPFQTV